MELGFFNSNFDSSLFIYNRDDILFYVLVYVDDLILTGNNNQFLQNVVKSLGDKFSLKELSDLHYFLGVEVIPVKQGLFLSQNQYVHNILHQLKMTGAKEVQTPMSVSTKLFLNNGTMSCNATKYRSTIGSLQYLSLTCLDIGFAINRLAQFMHQPTVFHWQQVKRLLRYLKHTIHFGILLRRQLNPVLHGFPNADWEVILMIASLQLPTLFFLVTTKSVGAPVSKRSLLVHPPKQSIEPSQLLPLTWPGFNLFSLNLVSSFVTLHYCYVITLGPHNSVSIPSCIPR